MEHMDFINKNKKEMNNENKEMSDKNIEMSSKKKHCLINI
jgi:hypothetical protein